MNKEYILNQYQREFLNLFDVNTKHPVEELQTKLWVIPKDVKLKQKIFTNMWLDTCDYENSEFEIIPNEENYKLIIYTNED